jgi:retinol dehydrogenase 12
MPSFRDFVRTQFLLKIPNPTVSFASKTVIVTGANGGLGKEAAKHIVRLGASTVILGCRNLSKGNAAKREIETVSGVGSSVLQVWELDIESPASIKQFVDRANALPRLDVLINNAGIQSQKFSVVYGTERTLAVNVIGTFLLALQLLPKLRETARNYQTTPHMTFVGSAMYDVAKWPNQHGDNIFAWFEDKTHFSAINQ